jgi:hypothetical protein
MTIDQSTLDAVSVIIPTFNRATMLRECLESMVRQTVTPLEILVVDDGSTDQTAEVACSFGPIVQYFHQPNQGKPAALNNVLARAAGSWIWFFDDDDVALPDSIEVRLRARTSQPEASIVVSRLIWGRSDERGRMVAEEPLRWPSFDAPHFYSLYLRSCFASLSGMLVRAQRVREVGVFRRELLTSEDYDYALRLARGQVVSICDVATFICRRHEGVRGPLGHRYAASERERKFAEGDAAIGRWIRETHGLAEYVAPAARSGTSEREGLLARLQVMAAKGLPDEMAADAVALAHLLDESDEALREDEGHCLKGAMQERYLAFRLVEDPSVATRSLARLASYKSGREMLRHMSRGLIGLAWWRQGKAAERLRLAALALRLRLLAVNWGQRSSC